VVHASQSQLTFKLVGRRKRVAASAILACDLLQVEENRARYVAVDELLPAAAPLQIPAKVDHPDIAIVDVFAQPVGLDQRSERHRLSRRRRPEARSAPPRSRTTSRLPSPAFGRASAPSAGCRTGRV